MTIPFWREIFPAAAVVVVAFYAPVVVVAHGVAADVVEALVLVRAAAAADVVAVDVAWNTLPSPLWFSGPNFPRLKSSKSDKMIHLQKLFKSENVKVRSTVEGPY